jgi:carbon monoxide dehydrogenase subunit G
MSETVVIKDRIDLPQSPDELFALLSDMEAVAPCVPGAVLDPLAESPQDPADRIREGAERSGHIVMAFGPIRYRYEGTILLKELRPDERKVVYHGSADEASGEGAFGVDLALKVAGGIGQSTLEVLADVTVSGMIAEYGKSMVDDVAQDVIAQFGAAVRARYAAKPAREADGSGEPTRLAQSQPRAIGGFRMLFRITFRRIMKMLRGGRVDPSENA